MHHTKGLKVEPRHAESGYSLVGSWKPGVKGKQVKVDAAYINRLIAEDEARQGAYQKLQKSDEDLLVNLGNLGNARLEQVELNSEYELMVEDFLDTFNHAVTQGVAPIRAVYAMCQGFGITLGCALRADLPFPVAKALVQMILTTASAQEKMLRSITQSMPKM